MYFELLEKAAQCRKEALRLHELGKPEFARRWIEIGCRYVQSAALARNVFASLGDSPLPG